MAKYEAPTYPRVQLTPARHKKLAMAAKKLGVGIAELVEGLLKKATK